MPAKPKPVPRNAATKATTANKAAAELEEEASDEEELPVELIVGGERKAKAMKVFLKKKAKVLIGYAFVDLTDDKSFIQGKYNERSVIPAKVAELEHSFYTGGARVTENAIPLMVDPKQLDPKTYSLDDRGIKMLVVIADGKSSWIGVLCGGRYRSEALKNMKKTADLEMKKIKENLAASQKKKGERAADNWAKLEIELKEVEDRVQRLGIWRVELFDEGECALTAWE